MLLIGAFSVPRGAERSSFFRVVHTKGSCLHRIDQLSEGEALNLALNAQKRRREVQSVPRPKHDRTKERDVRR